MYANDQGESIGKEKESLAKLPGKCMPMIPEDPLERKRKFWQHGWPKNRNFGKIAEKNYANDPGGSIGKETEILAAWLAK